MNATSPKHDPMYGWALDHQGNPVPIGAAIRGEVYRCPVCHSEMVAKMGDVKQHHFAHLNLLQCTPDNVARAVAGLWLADQLRERLTKNLPAIVTWTSPQQEARSLDILKGVASVVQNEDMEWGVGDVILLNQQGKPQTIILLGMENMPDQTQVAQWVKDGVTAILLDATGVRSGQLNLEQLLTQSTVLGGWWTQPTAGNNFVTDKEEIQSTLKSLVEKPPYVFYRQLVAVGDKQHVLEIEDKKLWLPPDIWEQMMGGSKNKLHSDIQVIITEWKEADGDTIGIFYITVHDSTALAIRRYDPHQPMRIQLDNAVFVLKKATALDLARQIVGHSMELPR